MSAPNPTPPKDLPEMNTSTSETSLHLREALYSSGLIRKHSPTPPGSRFIMSSNWSRFSEDETSNEDIDMRASVLLNNKGVKYSYSPPTKEQFDLSGRPPFVAEEKHRGAKAPQAKSGGRKVVFKQNGAASIAVPQQKVVDRETTTAQCQPTPYPQDMLDSKAQAQRATQQQQQPPQPRCAPPNVPPQQQPQQFQPGMTYTRERAARIAQQQRHQAEALALKKQKAKQFQLEQEQQEEQEQEQEDDEYATASTWSSLSTSTTSSTSGSDKEHTSLISSPLLSFEKKKNLDKASTTSLLTESLSSIKLFKTPALTDGASISAVSSTESFLEMKRTARENRGSAVTRNAMTATKHPRVTFDMAREYGIEELSASKLGDVFEEPGDEE